MTPNLKISKTVTDRLSNIKRKCFGKLFGTFYEDSLIVMAFLIDDDESDDTSSYCFPSEIVLCGIVSVNDSNYEEAAIKQYLSEIEFTDTPVYICCNISNGRSMISANFVINERIKNTTYQFIQVQEVYSQFVHVRMKTKLPLTFEPTEDSIKEAFVNAKKLLSSGMMAFNIDKTSIHLLGSDIENSIVGLSNDAEVGALFQEIGIHEGCGKKRRSCTYTMDFLTTSALKRITKDNNLHIINNTHAPIILVDKRVKKSTMTIHIDALSLVNRATKLINLYAILVESCIRNLKLHERCILNHFHFDTEDVDKRSLLIEPEIHHFYPDDCGHFVSWAYPKSYEENNLQNERQLLHKQLCVPANQPVFRRANQYMFKEDLGGNKPLINTHMGLNPSGNGGDVALVKGKYSYYHYCQNNMDDDGWGCAYRSLQTLASWFRLQGYTSKSVPTFEEIQKCLVDIGDKPASFIGSKQWIGSTEVNFVLNTLLGVTSKILYVSSGEELGSKGPELMNHFQTNGSPIMIGGGVLAHTILGVDYNKQTGTLKFLILDPHYTGKEDLRTIQSKGWCGWKGVDFWNKNAYYNMCLPQVPVCI